MCTFDSYNRGIPLLYLEIPARLCLFLLLFFFLIQRSTAKFAVYNKFLVYYKVGDINGLFTTIPPRILIQPQVLL